MEKLTDSKGQINGPFVFTIIILLVCIFITMAIGLYGMKNPMIKDETPQEFVEELKMTYEVFYR